MTKEVKKTKGTAQQKKMEFMRELVKEYGEGAVIRVKDMIAVAEKTDYKKYINSGVSAVRHDGNYKVARGQYVVTSDENPTKARDNAAKTAKMETAKKEKRQLPKAVRKSPKKLVEALTQNDDFSDTLAYDDGSDEDMGDFMRQTGLGQ